MAKRLFTILLCLFVSLMSVSAVYAADAPVVTVTAASGKTGDNVDVTVELEGNTGFASLGIEIGYDSSALRLVNAVAESSVGATYTPAQSLEANPYNMGWDSMSNVSYNGPLATLTFEIITEKSGDYPITVDYYKGRNGNYTDGYDTNYDENFDDINLSYVPGLIHVESNTVSGGGGSTDAPIVSVGSADGVSGDTVQLPVELEQNPGFASLGIEIGYDSSALKLTGVDASSDVGGICTTAQDFTVNPYNIGWDSMSNIAYNGTLATLTFEILTDAPGNYPVTVSYYKGRNGNYTDGYDVNYDENFDSLNLCYNDGCVTVNAAEGVQVDVGISFTDGTYANALFKSADYEGYVIAAAYNADNRLLSLAKCEAGSKVEFMFDNAGECAYVKVMWWGEEMNFRPLCTSQLIAFN